jgi:hypothetical protein
MKVSFIVTLLTVGCASAATRVLKGNKGQGKGKACFETAYDAAAIGNTILADFWDDVHMTGCEPAGIAKAIRKVFAKDVTVSIFGGSPIVEDVDGAIALLVGAAGIEGSLTEICINSFMSWYAHGAVTGDDNTFVLYANELTSPQAAVTIPVGMSPMLNFYASFFLLSMPLISTFCIIRPRVYNCRQQKVRGCHHCCQCRWRLACFPWPVRLEEYTLQLHK